MKRLNEVAKKEEDFLNSSRDKVMFEVEGSNEEKINTSLEVENKTSEEVKKLGSLEDKIKRSYMLKKSTVKLLDRMRLDYYDVGITLEEIVDEAIVKLYKSKKE